MRTGLERLLAKEVPELQGRRVGLYVNPGAVARDMTPAVTALVDGEAVRVVRLFAGEHGLWGAQAAGEEVPDAKDPFTGLDVVSLYREEMASLGQALADVEAVVVDAQDVGVRYYTVLGTILRLLEQAYGAGVPLFVLDRPNPLGDALEGQPAPDPSLRSLVGETAVPMRHGLTLGELVRWAARERGWEDGVQVVPMEGWRRDLLWPQLGRSWVPPSPNLAAWESVRLYPGTCLVEGTNLSEGRGTAFPFQVAGAPWIDPYRLARDAQPWMPPGVRLRPVAFVPAAQKHAGQLCYGVMVHAEPQGDVPAVTVGLGLVWAALRQEGTRILPPSSPQGRAFFDLLGGDANLARHLEEGRTPTELLAGWRQGLEAFYEARRSVLLYA